MLECMLGTGLIDDVSMTKRSADRQCQLNPCQGASQEIPQQLQPDASRHRFERSVRDGKTDVLAQRGQDPPAAIALPPV